MDVGDFTVFIFAPVLLLPLTAIYVSLRSLKWESRKGLFNDAWLIWLTWLISTIASYLAVIVIASNAHVYYSLSDFIWIVINLAAVCIVNLMTVSVLVLFLSRPIETVGSIIASSRSERTMSRPSPAFVSLITTMAATSTLVIAIGLASAIVAVYNHYYPPPPFAAYDA